ncbi:hypothetical protein KJK34_12160 [Flavobacterium sp. D11R37]|uniref:hypothetical protein n=1 Tax=Flavobacterium coralii TaxID=2838017 RepID=UPI001CA70B87|nr:hypothetical protein [Flavobacterium coralii]MBY8963508.1 hypothetical protein [Flavobacterium coralii]
MKPIYIKIIYIAIALVLLGDLVFSYKQYDRSGVDGDFPRIVLGQDNYDKVLNDPLGISTFSGESYPGTNRYTAHKLMSVYFKHVPFFFQNFLSPIDSLYLSITLAKFAIHLMLLLLFGAYINAWFRWAKWKSYLISAAIISPLFIGGSVYTEHLQVLDPCITYAMFYPLPLAALLAYYLPFYKYYITGNISKSPSFIVLWILFALGLVFFGPLPAALLLTSSPLLAIGLLWRAYGKLPAGSGRIVNVLKELDRTIVILLGFAFVFALYSFYVGTKNSESADPMALKERFLLLFKGIQEVFFNKEHGVAYLFLATVINVLLLAYLYGKENKVFLYLVAGLAVFSLMYIFLLPLGGYRYYRPLILRRDTTLPVLFILFYVFTTSGLLLLRRCPGKFKAYPFVFITIVVLHFGITDISMPGYYNRKEQKPLMEDVAASKEDCVVLNHTVPIASWNFNVKCEESENVANFLLFYRITPRKIYVRYKDDYKEPVK